MFLFCPNCGTHLTLQVGPETGVNEFACKTCSYAYEVKKRIISRKYPTLKEVDEVLSDAGAWINADLTDEKCPKCEHPKAYFMQQQTRSADEPMTIFYRCQNCTFRWKE